MSKPFYYGGQAVLEGVMMRGRNSMAVAVRAPAGHIVVYEEQLQPGPVLQKVRHVPFLRGMFVLWDTLLLGMRALMFSANVGLQEEPGEVDSKAPAKEAQEPAVLSGPVLWLTVAISVLLSIGLFFVLPLVIIDILDRWIESHFVTDLIEGVIRLGILVGYMLLIARMEDIRRVFAYHGAEHMTINAYEAQAPVDVDNVRGFGLQHVRCGTGFLLIVVLISIFVFMLVSAAFGELAWYWKYLSRIALVPFIAAFGYEVIRFGAAHASNRLVQLLLAPGLYLQRVTTRQPDDSMLEVAIAAFKRVLASDAVIAAEELDAAVLLVDQTGRPVMSPVAPSMSPMPVGIEAD
jgi:uncharacterized protein YqhQ